jgi:DNA repair protein RecN (Recombination protein N)
MIKSLFIRNFVLIDELDIHFENGFSVITGETGAGKSIILGALGLVLGERADIKSIQAGSDKCIIEATFDISSYNLKQFFPDNDLEYDAGECIIRRELLSTGKTRAFVNDTPVSLSTVKSLGENLIDIHSQHQNLLISESRFQLNVVDIIAGTGNKLKEYKELYNEYQDINDKISQLKEKAVNAQREEDFIRFQFDELSSVKLISGEQSEWESELEVLTHTEEIKSALFNITEILSGENISSVVQQLKGSIARINKIRPFFAKATEYAERLNSAYIDLKDLSSETNILKEDIEFSPERLEWINGRLNSIYSLQQKHRVASVDELIDLMDEFGKKLQEIESFDEELSALTGKQEQLFDDVVKQAEDISKLRRESSGKIEDEIIKRMKMLGIANTRFKVLFNKRKRPAADGVDDVTFLFSANKNEELKPVAQTASGGEISRLMLCFKSMIAGFEALPTIIFDEIDTGVSGEIADKMAGIMHELGTEMQVITITHLPQIAARGKVQYFVYKEDDGDRTLTRIRKLDDRERVSEVARMLSGSTLTDAAIENAKSLLRVK